jgi:hypothetical protein
MSNLTTPKLGKFVNTVYYYKQKYLNWEYVSSSSFDDFIIQEIQADFHSDLSRPTFRGLRVYGDTLLSLEARRYFTEEGLRDKYVTISVTVTSAYNAFVKLVDISNVLPFPSNIQLTINKNLYAESNTYKTDIQLPYVDIESVSKDDILTSRFRFRAPYPASTVSRSCKITNADTDGMIPYHTHVSVTSPSIYSGRSQTVNKALIVRSIYIAHTPTNRTTFQQRVYVPIIDNRSMLAMRGYRSKLRIRYPACIISSSFSLLQGFGYSYSSSTKRLYFVSARYIGQ